MCWKIFRKIIERNLDLETMASQQWSCLVWDSQFVHVDKDLALDPLRVSFDFLE